MNFPKSNIPEIQSRIDRVAELFETIDEETVYWLKWQHACWLANQERLGDNLSMKAGNWAEKENPKKD